MNSRNDENERTVLSPQQARQGEVSGRGRVILTVSMLLAILAGVAFVIYYNA